MKQVEAFVHRGRIADIVQALEAGGFRHLSVVDVKSLLHALSDLEQNYSIELGERSSTRQRSRCSARTIKSSMPCRSSGNSDERDRRPAGYMRARWIASGPSIDR